VFRLYPEYIYGVVSPPNLGEWITGTRAWLRLNQYLPCGEILFYVDFCEQMVKETNPSVLEKAE